ncbi:MAG: transcription-repair coupling factor [Actinobacteria bacterium]|nr:transcription-repair coupling factor [Actinomycetota bacterium]
MQVSKKMNIFLKKFMESQNWKDFAYNHVGKPYSFLSDDNFLKTAVADEEIWPFIIISLHLYIEMPFFIVTSTSDRASEIIRELKILSGDTDIFAYPSNIRNLLKQNTAVYTEELSERLTTLKKISEFSMAAQNSRTSRPFIAVAAANAIIDKIPSLELISDNNFEFKTGITYTRNRIIEELVQRGYERVSKVFDKGEFSLKGDVADVFDIASVNPCRVDIKLDTVENIYSYNIENASPIERLDKISVFPVNAIKADSEIKGQDSISISDFLNDSIKNYCFMVCDEPEASLKIKSEINIIKKSLENNMILQNVKLISPDFFEKNAINRINYRIDLASGAFEPSGHDVFIFDGVKRQKKNQGNAANFIGRVKSDLRNKKTVALSMNNLQRIKKIERILTDSGVSFKNHFINQYGRKKDENEISEKADFGQGIINIFNINLLSGFVSEELSLYGELDIYEQIENSLELSSVDIKSKSEFEPGDYIVHKNHGIGRYVNVVSEQINGNKREYFLIEYANNDRLFVPVWQSDRIHRYIGDKTPVISALNSKQWESLRKKIRNSVQKLAVDLAALYAARETLDGFAFNADDIWQKEMEDLFPFTETRDQLKAIEMVKELMSIPKPMDLLVCGDVGFGKTEVAVRSAFKAIENGKQVLMLVPTTILADQHANTFRQRYENFPVIVDVISRFKSVKQQKEIIKRFEEKKVDMLIGTHRILSEDIKPSDLGLVIIDEEQRFGVNAKEKLKLLKKNVDALTLSATPIPRTLYMSLAGIRDIVLIETNPSGRFPIETFVGENNDIVIKMAIEREIKRGGQVYYVHNKISDIYEKQYRLNYLVSDARIAVTHGRMEGKEIEKIMEMFIDKKFDVLLTTTIIESGMDISNVNTLIVENSHKFGLAQLYQIRGRVGRSSEKAYAYFFYPDRKILNQTAFQRLKSLSEYTDLGSGYKIAMKDLEIRGAGELLGARQHGHINSVGFDMYCQIIKEEVDKLKGISVQEDINIQIELPVSAYIPKNYITRETDRINIYKLLGSLEEIKSADSIENDMIKKHGKMPEVVKNLVMIAKIKVTAKKAGIEQIIYSERKGLVFKKINLSENKARAFLNIHNDFNYLQRNREMILKKPFKDLNLHLVLNYLNDIIAFI